MLIIAIVTLLCLVVAGLVLFYAAYPNRGETPPAQAEWLGDVLNRAAEALPVIDPDKELTASSAAGRDAEG